MNTARNTDEDDFILPEGFKWYMDAKGSSRIMAYKEEDKAIHVLFVYGDAYVYTEESVGKTNLMYMKSLATEGQGLSGFINTYVGDKYTEKYPT